MAYREVGAATARHDRPNGRVLRRGYERSRSAGAGTKVSKRPALAFGCASKPSGGIREAMRQEVDVEDVVAVGSLVFGQQIEKQGTNALFLQGLGDELIAGTQAAAPAAMSKQDHADCFFRNHQLAFQANGVRGN